MSQSPNPPPPDVRPASAPLLFVLVFLTGGVILVLEIVGARLLSPAFGANMSQLCGAPGKTWSSVDTPAWSSRVA